MIGRRLPGGFNTADENDIIQKGPGGVWYTRGAAEVVGPTVVVGPIEATATMEIRLGQSVTVEINTTAPFFAWNQLSSYTLCADALAGDIIRVVDIGGDAAYTGIKVLPGSGTIDGDTEYNIKTKFGMVAFYRTSAGKWAILAEAPSAPAPDIQFFTMDGTWYKPTNAQFTVFVLVGAGAAGQSVSNSGAGGHGGGAGYRFEATFPSSQLPATMEVNIGAMSGAPTIVLGVAPTISVVARGANTSGGDGSSGGGARGVDGSPGGSGGAFGSDGGPGDGTFLPGKGMSAGGAGGLGGAPSIDEGSAGGGAGGPMAVGPTAGQGGSNTIGPVTRSGGLGGTGYGAGGGGAARGNDSAIGGHPVAGCALILTYRHP